MARPNKDRTRRSLWISRGGDDAVVSESKRRGVSISDLYREIIKIGFRHYSNGERVK